MIIPDANLLIYAHDERSVFHRKAHAWWKSTLGGTEPIGIPWVVILAFTRLMTHPQICENPLGIKETRGIVLHWLSFPHVRLLQVSDHAVSRFFDLLDQAGSGGNLSTDALIALHALEQSATVYSSDLDFGRFAGVRRVDPLQKGT
ncbi:MAG: PIN domain-containing protein [Puniceicoccaceae bacterium]|nr:MAG: PIN domain-containing protein [Puniceicoccaceae bacterium]